MKSEKIWFLIDEFARLLGYSEIEIAYRLTIDEFKTTWKELNPLSKELNENMKFVSEVGLYWMALKSVLSYESKFFPIFINEVIVSCIRYKRIEQLKEDIEIYKKMYDDLKRNGKVMPSANHKILKIYQKGNFYRFIRAQKRNLKNAERKVGAGEKCVLETLIAIDDWDILTRVKEHLFDGHIAKNNTIVSDSDILEKVKLELGLIGRVVSSNS